MVVDTLAMVFWSFLIIVTLFSTPLKSVLLLRRGILQMVREETGSHWLTALHLIGGTLLLFGYAVLMNSVLAGIQAKPPYFTDLGYACLATAGVVLYFDLRKALVRQLNK